MPTTLSVIRRAAFEAVPVEMATGTWDPRRSPMAAAAFSVTITSSARAGSAIRPLMMAKRSWLNSRPSTLPTRTTSLFRAQADQVVFDE